jgi:hypothetical protein
VGTGAVWARAATGAAATVTYSTPRHATPTRIPFVLEDEPAGSNHRLWHRRAARLASLAPPWQDARMARPTPSPPAGGALIALGSIVGAAAGFVVAQPTLGFLLGLGLGVAASVAIWLRHRTR